MVRQECRHHPEAGYGEHDADRQFHRRADAPPNQGRWLSSEARGKPCDGADLSRRPLDARGAMLVRGPLLCYYAWPPAEVTTPLPVVLVISSKRRENSSTTTGSPPETLARAVTISLVKTSSALPGRS